MSNLAAKELQILNGQSLTVLDIGARGKLVPQFVPVASQTHVIGFEPDPQEATRLTAELAASGWASAKILPTAVGAPAKDRKLYIMKNPGLSSLMLPNTNWLSKDQDQWEIEKTILLDTRGLDDLVAQGEIPTTVDFIKIDTQGTELEIFKTGEQVVLSNVLGIQTEVEFIEQYIGQPYIEDVTSFLREKGFDPMLLRSASYYTSTQGMPYTRRRLVHGDLLFLRDERWLDKLDPVRRQEVLPKLVALYALHKLFGEGVRIARKYNESVLADKVIAVHNSFAKQPWKWYAKLGYTFLKCLIQPSRRNRLELAEQACRVGAGVGRYMLFDVHPGI